MILGVGLAVFAEAQGIRAVAPKVGGAREGHHSTVKLCYGALRGTTGHGASGEERGRRSLRSTGSSVSTRLDARWNCQNDSREGTVAGTAKAVPEERADGALSLLQVSTCTHRRYLP